MLLQDFAGRDHRHVWTVRVMGSGDKRIHASERVQNDVHWIASLDLERLVELLLGEADRSVRRVDR